MRLPSRLFPLRQPISPLLFIPAALLFKGALLLQDKNTNCRFTTVCFTLVKKHSNRVCVCVAHMHLCVQSSSCIVYYSFRLGDSCFNRKCLCVFLQQRNLEGYVGFANLPNQVYRKSVKRGFEFTLMVVGKLGTYTFVPWVRMWMCGSMIVLAQAKPMNAHLPICLHLLVCVCCHFSVNVSHRCRLKGGKACWASSALSCSGWQVDNLKISLCRVVMPCVAWIWKHLPCCSVTENVHMWKVLVVKARFPQFPRRVFLLTPGRTITHLCVLDDLIWKWAAGCWFKYEWTWLQNVANSITDGGKSTKKWRNCGFGCLHWHIHTHTHTHTQAMRGRYIGVIVIKCDLVSQQGFCNTVIFKS